jgi:hypothetical protein
MFLLDDIGRELGFWPSIHSGTGRRARDDLGR